MQHHSLPRPSEFAAVDAGDAFEAVEQRPQAVLPVDALWLHAQADGSAAAGDGLWSYDDERCVGLFGGVQQAWPGMQPQSPEGFVSEIEYDDRKAAGLQDELGATHAVAWRRWAHPQHTTEIGTGGGNRCRMQSVGKIDAGHNFTAPASRGE